MNNIISQGICNSNRASLGRSDVVSETQTVVRGIAHSNSQFKEQIPPPKSAGTTENYVLEMKNVGDDMDIQCLSDALKKSQKSELRTRSKVIPVKPFRQLVQKTLGKNALCFPHCQQCSDPPI